MPRKWLRRWLPSPHRVRSDRTLRVFGQLLANRQLWALNRRSVARATGIGLFLAFVPFPSQMILAAGAAIWLGFNLPVALVMVWITNPLTFPFIFYFAYRLGAWLLSTPARALEFEMSFSWLAGQVADIWAPLLLGCCILGVVSGTLGHTLISVGWRIYVLRNWRRRRRKSAKAAARGWRANRQRVPASDPTARPDPGRESPESG